FCSDCSLAARCPMEDASKFFLFVALSLLVLVMVTDRRRPLARAPLDADDAVLQSQTADDASLITRGPGFANVPSNGTVPPLSLMMPQTGIQPYDGSVGDAG
ncbi:hypothetical protein, partial [Staphylococcus haemolyticus]|uniref:hypothetical protein n=4 Tax=Bacteria TaxID=2 RepID=UPI002B250E70